MEWYFISKPRAFEAFLGQLSVECRGTYLEPFNFGAQLNFSEKLQSCTWHSVIHSDIRPLMGQVME